MGVNEPVHDLPTEAEPPRGLVGYFGRHPKGFWFIFWGELAERSSYYGMRALLVIYMTSVLRFKEDYALSVYFIFKATCYLMPLVGGFIADRFLGKYWTIVGFAVPYVIGQVLLAVPDPVWLYVGMAILACGTGVIKPNISTLMGMTYDQQRPGDEQLRTNAFFMFYFAIKDRKS